MAPPIYNALAAGKGGVPNQPVTKPAPTPAQSAKPVKPANQPTIPGPNSRPDKNANAGQSPAMMGDKQKIARPPAQTIAASGQIARPQESRSGMETAMGAAADKLHPVKRR